ncbi:MAG: hypothetical protein ACLQVF_14055, partial [Isosphaeraceae bacterium]
SIAVGGFSVLDNHLYLLVRLDPDVAAAWSDEGVVRRWGRLFPHVARLQRVGGVAAQRCRLGGQGPRAAAKRQLVHEKLSEGRFLAASRQRLREVAERLGLRRAVNLGGCLVT